MRRLLNGYMVIWLIVFIFTFLLAIQPFSHSDISIFAQQCNEGDPQLQEICLSLNDLQNRLQQSIAATKPLEKIVKDLENQLDSIQKKINLRNLQIKELEKSIFEREVDLVYQEEVLKMKVRDYYKRSKFYSPLLIFLSSETASQLTKELTFRQATVDEDRKIIVQISQNIIKLKEDKEKLKEDQSLLSGLQKKLDSQKAFFEGEIRGAKAYQVDLSQEIAELTAKQKALLAEKTGTFQTSVGEVPLADDPNSRPDFDPGFRPAFAAFSFGAPHRKGMSQYGAYGRAKAGQSAEEILRAYYGGGIEIKKDYPNVSIHVKGWEYCNPDRGNYIDETVDLETYTKRIYEMPSSWTDNDLAALKAQAVAARSYALARGGEICPSECCQVYRSANKGGAWDTAVEATRGWVLMANGQPFSAWYACTAGGYTYSYSSQGHTTPGIWDTSCGSQDCWTNEAWEKKADSPWFYKGWYKSRSGTSCGRSHPWLTSEEMADLVNAAVVYQKNKGNDEVISHIWQLDSCYSSGADVWSKDKMKQEGAGVSGVSGVSVVYSNSGITAKVIFQTDKGTIEVEGSSFYDAFNRRVPGAIHLTSGLFNIEKK